jgi:undecaprenyl-diphosphatase
VKGHDRTVEDDHSALEHLLLTDHPRAIRIATWLWAVSGALFVVMAIAPLRDAVQAFDETIYDATYPIKWGPLTAVAKTLAFLGSVWFVWPFRAVVTAVLWVRRRYVALVAWLVPIVLSEPFIGLLKAAYDRPRPSIALVTSATAAFPSGHAVAGSVMALSIVIVFVPAGPRRRNLKLAAAAFAFLMAASRMYLGAHWFTDVVAGMAFGAAAAIGGAALVQRVAVETRVRARLRKDVRH